MGRDVRVRAVPQDHRLHHSADERRELTAAWYAVRDDCIPRPF